VAEIVSGIADHAAEDESFAMPKQGIRQGSRLTLFASEPAKREKIHVAVLDRDRGIIELRTSTLQGATTTRCEITTEREDAVDVVYSMVSDSFDEQKKGFIAGFSKAYYLGRMSDFLQEMTKRVLDRREGITPAMRAAEKKRQTDRNILGFRRRSKATA
jgi:hypothetical protein